MLTLPPSVRIVLAREATDVRKGIDGLCAMARDAVGEDRGGDGIRFGCS